jgi:hypothetical protein
LGFFNQRRLMALLIIFLGLILFVQSPPSGQTLPLLIEVIGAILFFTTKEGNGD